MTRIQQFDYSVDIEQALIWQYNNAVSLISLTTQKQAWYTDNQSSFWSNWYTNVFNLQTANQFGLSVWAYILGIPLFVNTGSESLDGTQFFGFNQYTSFPTLINSYENYNGIGPTSDFIQFDNGANFSDRSNSEILTVEEQRFILQLRYFQLTTRADIVDINAFLNYLYVQKLNLPEPFGPIWALDNLNMTMRYVFNYSINPVLLQVLLELDLLARPATVGIQPFVNTGLIFGLDTQDYPPSTSNYQNFNGVGNTSDFIPLVNGSNFIPDNFFSFGD